MNEQSNNEQNTASPQNTQNTINLSDSQPIIKKSIPIIKQGGCGCGKRRQL